MVTTNLSGHQLIRRQNCLYHSFGALPPDWMFPNGT